MVIDLLKQQRRNNNAEIGTRSTEYCYDGSDHVVIWGGVWKGFLELYTEDAVEYSELKELFCGSLEDKIVKRNAHIKDLFCKV